MRQFYEFLVERVRQIHRQNTPHHIGRYFGTNIHSWRGCLEKLDWDFSMINLIKCSAISRVLIFTLFRHQGCGDQSGNGPGSVCSKLSLCLRNGSLNATGAGHQGNQGKPVAELCGHRLNQLEDLASHSAHQLLLCAFPASDTGEQDLKRFPFINRVYLVNIGSILLNTYLATESN